jgi:hypothetical protein
MGYDAVLLEVVYPEHLDGRVILPCLRAGI